MNRRLPGKIKHGKITSIIGVSVVILVYAIIAFRSLVKFEADIYDTPIHDSFVRTELAGRDAYALKLSVPEQQKEIGIGKIISIANVYYTPKVRQMQLCVKYNSGVAAAPTDNRIPFTFSLCDKEGNVYTDYYFRVDQRYGSRYIRVCFKNVEYDVLEDGKFVFELTKNEENADLTVSRTTSFDFAFEKGKSRRVKYDF